MSKGCDVKIKTSFIGFGKRTKLFYAPILKKLNDSFDLLGFTKKTKNNADSISNQYNIDFYDSADILLQKTQPDLLILSVPSSEIIEILKKIKNPNCVVFVDTPFCIDIDQAFNLNIQSLLGDTIYLTIDGSIPTINSDVFTDSIFI